MLTDAKRSEQRKTAHVHIYIFEPYILVL